MTDLVTAVSILVAVTQGITVSATPTTACVVFRTTVQHHRGLAVGCTDATGAITGGITYRRSWRYCGLSGHIVQPYSDVPDFSCVELSACGLPAKTFCPGDSR